MENEPIKENEPLNPWLHIWTRPRQTMRSILDTDPKKFIVWLAIIGGMLSGLVFTMMIFKDSHHRGIATFVLIFALIIGGLIGLFHLYFGGWLYRLTGGWIGGKGTFTETKSAVGWSNYPFIIASIANLLAILTRKYAWLPMVFAIINFVLAIWGLVIFLNLLAEAHKFSVWKSILAVLIACVLIFVVFILIALLIPLLKPIFQ